MASSYKTPGVYVEEISLFPPSVAQVATAIPAFIGYTERAIDLDGNSLLNVPTKINSFNEFRQLFGEAYRLDSINAVIDTDDGNIVKTIKPNRRFYLWDSMRLFFDNGGFDCYIISVGLFEKVGLTQPITASEFTSGMEALKKFDEPTLILFPDAVGLEVLVDAKMIPDRNKFYELQKQALMQCASLQDRFCIFDVMNIDLDKEIETNSVTACRDNIGTNALNYGATYYPWLESNFEFGIDLRLLKVKDKNGDLFLDITDAIADDATFEAISEGDERALIDLLVDDIFNSDVVSDLGNSFTPATARGPKALTKEDVRINGIDRIKNWVKDQKNEIRQLIIDGTNPEDNINQLLNVVGGLPRLIAQVEKDLKAEQVAPHTEKNKNLLADFAALKGDSIYVEALKSWIAFEKKLPTALGRTVDVDYAGLATDWLGGVALNAIVADTASYDNIEAQISGVSKYMTGLLNGYKTILDAAKYYEDVSSQTLFTEHTFFKPLNQAFIKYMRTLPPSGAMAGVYTRIDEARGVWKAPANTSLDSVIGPSIKINHKDQEDLNVHTTGKSINAIRHFTGKGTLVWGARTLEGNSNEWRYVPVRRFFIMVEESVKKASEQFVFEPNDANTWVKIRAMIENFLVLQWRAGALQGAKPEDAFYVKVGVPETMTALDILEGRMIIEIGMAVVRPAEFIILRFSHKMLTEQ